MREKSRATIQVTLFLCARYQRFKELSILRRQKLEDSFSFQCFRRDADELEKWIQEKLQIASDENYKDPSNLQVLDISDLFLRGLAL